MASKVDILPRSGPSVRVSHNSCHGNLQVGTERKPPRTWATAVSDVGGFGTALSPAFCCCVGEKKHS